MDLRTSIEVALKQIKFQNMNQDTQTETIIMNLVSVERIIQQVRNDLQLHVNNE